MRNTPQYKVCNFFLPVLFNYFTEFLFHPYLQIHMKEVMSAVWLHSLDINYLREQVGNPKDAF